MSTNFPSGLDALNNPTTADFLDTVGVLHDQQHANANDAIEALQAKVGVTSSAVVTSLDYKITNHLAAADPHTQYQKESERNAVNGYAGLDGSSLLTASQVPNLPESRITNLITDLAAAVQRANHTGTQLSSTISDLTETVQDVVAAELVAGTNISLSYNDPGGQLTINSVFANIYDANTVLKADTDNTPVALTMGPSTILARLAAGSIVAATPAEARVLTNTVNLSGDTMTGELIVPDVKVSGLTGSTTLTRYVGGTVSGPPVSGAHLVGDWVVDQTPAIYVCLTAGTPGVWTNVGKSELARGECLTAQSTNTTTIDIPGCSITFTVGALPVYVTGRFPMVVSLTDGTAFGYLTDAANAVKDQNWFTSTSIGAIGNFGTITLEEKITTPGTYTRKLRWLGSSAPAASSIANYLSSSKISIMAEQK